MRYNGTPYMTGRKLAVVAAMLVGLLLVGWLGARTYGHLTSINFDPNDVTRCDEAAAHPEDRQRVVQKGVHDDEILSGPAVKACDEAVYAHPEVARFHFQFGRALAAEGMLDEAAESFIQAWEMKHCAAGAYLADAYLNGIIEVNDSEDSEETAKDLYQKSAECGFAPAQEAYNRLTFDPSDYNTPTAMEALYNGDIIELNSYRPFAAMYLQGIHDYLAMEFHPYGPECPQLVEPTIVRDLEAAAAGDPRNVLERLLNQGLIKLAEFSTYFFDTVWPGDLQRYREYLLDIGRKDGVRLTNRYGCDPDSITAQIYENIKVFADAEQPLLETLEQENLEELGEKLKDQFLSPATEERPSGSQP